MYNLTHLYLLVLYRVTRDRREVTGHTRRKDRKEEEQEENYHRCQHQNLVRVSFVELMTGLVFFVMCFLSGVFVSDLF